MSAKNVPFPRPKLHFRDTFDPDLEARTLRILDHDPGNTECLSLLGMLHANSERFETAIQLLRAAIAIDGPKSWLCSNLGAVLNRIGDRPAAIACYRQALVESPTDARLWSELATLFTAENRHAESADAWLKALESAPSMDRLPLANALALAGDRARAIDFYDDVLRARPEDIEATFHRAVAFMQENQPLTAKVGFLRSIELAPAHSRAHNNLGILAQLDRDQPAAIRHYRAAVRFEPGFADALHNLGTVYNECGNVRAALGVFRKLLKLHPDHAAAWTNLGNAWLAWNRLDEAVASYRETLRLSPGDAAAEWNLGIVALLSGHLANGWKGYERRFDVPGSPGRRQFAAPLWRGEPIAGKSLLLHAEQGLGDTLQFIRYAQVFTHLGARVLVECQPALVPLLRCMACVEAWNPPAETVTDYQLSLLSAPGIAGTELTSIPLAEGYLRAPGAAVEKWRNWLGPRRRPLRVGFCRAGNPNHKNDRNRSMPAELAAELMNVDGVEWVSLLKGDPAPGAPELGDFADTAGLIENLDLVVSVDTAVAHLAGALGKPVWILLPFAPDWRWLLDRDDSPWYAGARLFRQREIRGWQGVIDELARAVKDRAILKP